MAEAQASDAYRILVVEDDDEWRELVTLGLRTKGYEVVAVDNADSAVIEARRRKFQVAVLDYQLPGKDGLQTMDALRRVDPDIEVILATGDAAADQVARQGIRHGAYAFLIKPFAQVELEALLPALGEKISLKALVALYDATRTVFADTELDELLPDLISLAAKVLNADDVSVMLLNDQKQLTVAASTAVAREEWGRLPPGPAAVAERVAQWRTGVNINGSLKADPRFADLPGRSDVGVSLVYPILLNQDLLGVLSANRKPGQRPFVAQDLRHAAIFCSMIAQAIHNAKLYDRLRNLDQLKDEFISMVSHDLRGPLNAVTMITDTLIGGEYGALGDEQSRLVRLVQNSTRKLAAFVANILDAAKIRSGQFKFFVKEVRLQEVLPRLTPLLAVSAASRGVELGHDVPDDLPAVAADPEKLDQVFNNLIGNALKFTPRGGAIRVTAALDGDSVRCVVRDTGLGIRAEDMGRLFVKFQQADVEHQRAMRMEGTGLGLSICKTIVEGHGGRIWVESEPGKGSAFYFTLPVCSARSTPAPGSAAGRASSAGLRDAPAPP